MTPASLSEFLCLRPPSQTSTSTGLSKGVSAQCLFDLLVSLEGETQDSLDALELVKAEKPLRSLGKSLSHTIFSAFCKRQQVKEGALGLNVCI